MDYISEKLSLHSVCVFQSEGTLVTFVVFNQNGHYLEKCILHLRDCLTLIVRTVLESNPHMPR